LVRTRRGGSGCWALIPLSTDIQEPISLSSVGRSFWPPKPSLVYASVVLTHTQLVPDALCIPKPTAVRHQSSQQSPVILSSPFPQNTTISPPTVDVVALRSLSGCAARGLVILSFRKLLKSMWAYSTSASLTFSCSIPVY